MAHALSEDTRSETTSNSTSDDRHFLTKAERDKIAEALKIPEKDVTLQKFRVSRRRMEHLIYGHSLETSQHGGDDPPFRATQFFDTIMSDTNTIITWPTRLKRNATSKKDPYILIYGRARNILEARIRVVEGLDPEVRKVTLKIDVSYTDHSHIIGRGGKEIKKVMLKTKCHIHFPDCNRSRHREKSNMVSIAGEVRGVEMARASVRELVPLVFAFDLPVLQGSCMHYKEHNPRISTIEEKYNVQVLISTKEWLNSTVVSVKGSRAEYDKVKEATETLIALLTMPYWEQVKIRGSMEISPHYHAIVRGKDDCNLNLIKASTGAKITFTDLQDPNIPEIKRSNVIITGNSVDSVYLALQVVTGSIPVDLAFDVPETMVTPTRLKNVSERYDVRIVSKLRQRASIFSLSVRGLERSIANIYEAYRVLTNYEAPEIAVEVPSTYMLPGALPYNVAMKKWDHSALSPSLSSLTPWSCSSSTTISPPPGHTSTNNLYHYYHAVHASRFKLRKNEQSQSRYSIWSHPLLPFGKHAAHQTTGEDIGRHSRSTSSLRDISGHSSTKAESIISSPGQSPIMSPRTASPASSVNLLTSDSGISQCKTSSSEFELTGLMENMKQSAIQAMNERPKSSELRIPTPVWAGLGFSNSSPPALLKRSADHPSRSNDGDEWGSIPGATSKSNETLSNICEVVGSLGIDSVTNAPYPVDLRTILGSVGMEKYYANFRSHEATDLDVFLNLNENDLIQIGISALGARKKLQMLIAEFNSRLNKFRSTPGAGRKRLRQNFWWPDA